MNSLTSRLSMLMLSAGLVAGCAQMPAAGPDYQSPALSLPSAWSTARSTSTEVAAAATPTAAKLDMARWWRQLNDPLLDSLIEEALAGSPDLRLAQARLRQARGSRAQAVSALYPSVSASGNASRSRNGPGGTAASSGTLYDAGFDASWEVDLFGANRRGVEAAAADLAASAASLDAARVSLVAEVAQNYVEARAYRDRIAIARDNLASQSETLQITEWRYQAGLVTSSDVEQARTSREQTRASIPDLEVSLAASENRLAVLLGRQPGSLHEQLVKTPAWAELPDTVAAGIPSGVLRQRPDLIAAERSLAAETARVGQSMARRFPSLNLGASFGWQAYSLAALGGAGTLARVVGGTLAATLFDGGQLKSAVEIQSAVQEQALITYESSVLSALEEVENALIAYAAGHERIAARRAAAQAARNAASLSRNLYQSGLADFQKVLETERTRLSAEDSLAVAEAGQRTSLIQLVKSLGGGWEPASSLPKEKT